MNYPEDAAKAANYLRLAIPHLVKHEIPANPINYTIWYSYVAKRIPALNTALDRIIKYSGTCTPKQSQELYFNYIINEHLEEHHQNLEEITKLAAHIIQRLCQSENGSLAFDEQLSLNIENLKNAKTVENITDTIDEVISASEDIRFANNIFRQQMKQANNEITSLKKQLQDAEKNACIDQLTQLYNRHAFDKQLNQLLKVSTITNNICLILADVDHFKSFNDNYGHVIGDRVLRRMGEIVLLHCPQNAISARYGGEEFAIIMTQSTLEDAVNVAENLRRRLEQLRIKTRKSDKTIDNISASFGIANFKQGESAESLIDRADRALYRAKGKGRNRVETQEESVITS